MQVMCEVHFYCALYVLPKEVKSFLITFLAFVSGTGVLLLVCVFIF